MPLMNDLKMLQKKSDEQGVLSIYLSTDFSSKSQQAGEWKILLKNGLKRLEEYVEKSGSHDELKAYKKISAEADKAIREQQANMQRSVVLFASADGEVWTEKYLQVPVETEFHWEKTPATDQLEKLQESFPSAGLILVQQRDVAYVDIGLGEVKDEMQYSWELDSEDWKEYKGNATSVRVASGSTQMDELKHRFEENRHRWYKSLASVLDKKVKDHGNQELYLIGSKEYVQDLQKHLNKEVTDVIPKNLFSSPSHELLNVVYDENVR
ncbi:protein required for attachment to host cells [Salsuginibacillus halophilus]|uniref:Protein required for attachment to host cells n=1 Tax=Salsuginibacillus halophilus TaxID=517424 RepID=A0A2P8HBK5_9BACI|nr:VLRF1 family aeRF1-type release factor [Salsuginibacillus halophilus]PSL43593.1 protein required for attachment to host cells [Salsuginibacillus halophilus]